MRCKILILGICLLLFACASFAQEAKKDGWWLKADPLKQGSQMMAFYVGTTGQSYMFWRVWTPGDPVEFDVPAEFRNGPSLYVLAQTTSGPKCRFCMMYQSKGVKYIEFDLEESYEAKQTEGDSKCR